MSTREGGSYYVLSRHAESGCGSNQKDREYLQTFVYIPSKNGYCYHGEIKHLFHN